MENTPTLWTQRLLLRRFTPEDLPALLAIYGDPQVNTFLPMFPLKTPQEAERFLQERYLNAYRLPVAYRYAICPHEGGLPIGYVHADGGPAHDLGYGLRRDCWGQGFATEACSALLQRLREDGQPFVTATHDVQNPKSGAVMRRLGMRYRYTYQERWQPKDRLVYFRMYQLNLDGQEERCYRGYWDRYPVHFVEEGL